MESVNKEEETRSKDRSPATGLFVVTLIALGFGAFQTERLNLSQQDLKQTEASVFFLNTQSDVDKARIAKLSQQLIVARKQPALVCPGTAEPL